MIIQVGKYQAYIGTRGAYITKRSYTNLHTNPGALQRLFGTTTGQVSQDNALKYSALWRAVDLISDTIAMLSWQVYKQEATGIEVARETAEYNLIHTRPCPGMSSFQWRKYMTVCALTWGNAFAHIKRNGNAQATELTPIHPSKLTKVYTDNAGERWYFFTDQKEPIHASDIIHLYMLTTDGVLGISPITYHAQTIALGLESKNLQQRYFEHGVTSPYYLSTPGALQEGRPEQLSKDFVEKFGGVNNGMRPPVLHSGMELKAIGVPQRDAQALEHTRFNIEEIARAYKLPLHKLGIHGQNTSHNSIEAQNLEYVQDCIMPWVKMIEQEVDYKLFSLSPYWNKIDLKTLLRGDTRTRWEAYRIGITNGIYSPNDVRQLEGLNNRPDDGGNQYLTPVNMATAEQVALQIKKLEEEIENQPNTQRLLNTNHILQ
jgi:HK97 family phage portal protein